MGVSKNEYEITQFNIVTGANAATNIAITGLAAEDKILKILNLTDLADVDPAGLVITAGNFKITASTAAKKLLVIWNDLSAG